MTHTNTNINTAVRGGENETVRQWTGRVRYRVRKRNTERKKADR